MFPLHVIKKMFQRGLLNYSPTTQDSYTVFIRGVISYKEAILKPELFPELKEVILSAIRESNSWQIVKLNEIRFFSGGHLYYTEERYTNPILSDDFIAISIDLAAENEEHIKKFIFNLPFINMEDQYVEIRKSIVIKSF